MRSRHLILIVLLISGLLIRMTERVVGQTGFLVGNIQSDKLEAARALYTQAFSLQEAGNYEGAVALMERSLTTLQNLLGPEHREVATVLHNLANLYYDKGDFVLAESSFKRALAIREKLFGAEDSSVAATWFSHSVGRGQASLR